VRQDLEAASKARHKLSLTSKAEDTKTITELHDQMTRLQGLSAYLPSLVQRLAALAVQHRNAATVQAQWQSTQATVQSLQSQVAAMETALTHMERHLQETATSVASSLASLEERLSDEMRTI
jgi:Tfp pilus assembly protein PilO